jgi:hypothetical protein
VLEHRVQCCLKRGDVPVNFGENQAFLNGGQQRGGQTRSAAAPRPNTIAWVSASWSAERATRIRPAPASASPSATAGPMPRPAPVRGVALARHAQSGAPPR